MRVIKSVTLGSVTVVYLQDDRSGRCELQLLPTAMTAEAGRVRRARRTHLSGPEIEHLPAAWKPMPAQFTDSLVQVRLRGDTASGGFASGMTMRNSSSVDDLRLVWQEIKRSKSAIVVETLLQTPQQVQFLHRLQWLRGESAVQVTTRCTNCGSEPVTLEMLASFSLGGISAFAPDDAPGRLFAHRARSCWSAEGRMESVPLELLHLERSWTGHACLSERFGQVGSMPVRGYFPFVAVEDRQAGVTWAASLATPASWQIEFYRKGDALALSGGLADRELGHWFKTLGSGESFTTPEAQLTVAQGGVEQACRQLVALQRYAPSLQAPAHEREMPIVFNEWCTSWGKPTHENLLLLADKLAGTPVKYLVIDDGWSRRPANFPQYNGDWEVDAEKFPHGLAATCAAIRERGLIPGLWFEFECCTRGTRAYEMTEHHLHLDGRLIEIGNRRFWDFRDPWVHDYLYEKVIVILKEAGFGYLKVDYNDTLGIGCDGADSPSQGLREHLEGVQAFFRRIRSELPGIVIENCSSGGHRLEPSMMAICAQGSFSDAHETLEIPLIAANLHNHILPRQSQIWAVLRHSDTAARLGYSLAATFLGRMALSGDVFALGKAQWQVLKRWMDLYVQAAPIIRDGQSRRYGSLGASFRHPEGWQAVLTQHGGRLLAVVHRFGGQAAQEQVLPLPLPLSTSDAAGTSGASGAGNRSSAGNTSGAGARRAAGWRIVHELGAGSGCVETAGTGARAGAQQLRLRLGRNFTARVFLLEIGD